MHKVLKWPDTLSGLLVWKRIIRANSIMHTVLKWCDTL